MGETAVAGGEGVEWGGEGWGEQGGASLSKGKEEAGGGGRYRQVLD